MVSLPTRPEANAIDMTKATAVETIRSVLEAARGCGVPVVYLQTGYKPDLFALRTPSSL